MQPITDFEIHVASGQRQPSHPSQYGMTCTLYDATVNGKRLGVGVFESGNSASIIVAWNDEDVTGAYTTPLFYTEDMPAGQRQHTYRPWMTNMCRVTPRMIVEAVADALGLVPVLYKAGLPAPKDLTLQSA